MDEKEIIKKITSKTKAIFMTYVQGFNGLSDSLLNHLDSLGIPLIEDVCESHGASHNGKKLGSFGLMSNFSFYYAHHMSTIEGGMVSTDNEQYYQILRMLRSHGMVREATNKKLQLNYAQDKNQLNPEFIFAYQAYNVRNTEIGAILGRNQLKRLDKVIRKRTYNLHIFLENLDRKRFRMNFDTEGSSNYAFNFVLNNEDFELRDRLEKVMREAGIEFRRGSAGGGNQLRQPYLSDYIEHESWKNFPETEHIHHFCWYVGNYPTLEEEKIRNLCNILNSA
jgi:CDP-6-deoxy-D-xylo-4-hexulose-3-dehydrase